MKKILKSFCTIAGLLLLFTACNKSDDNKTTVLTVINDADAVTLDPTGSNDIPSARVCVQIYDTLFSTNADGAIMPLLAKSYDAVSPTEYIIYLQEGVKFHNGDEMKASDVVFSLKRSLASPSSQSIIDCIDPDSIVAIDDYTVQFNLFYPFSGILNNLIHYTTSIVSEKVVTEAGIGYGQTADTAIGTGPFKIVSWEKANSLTLETNKNYHGTIPNFDKAVMKIIPETSNRFIELEAGNADIAYEIAPIDVPKIEENADLQLFITYNYSTNFLGFNCKHSPFDNPKVREAISYAIDIEPIINKIFLQPGSCALHYMPPNMKYSIAADKKPRKKDVEKAKQLLAEAGYAEGFSCNIVSNSNNKLRTDIATLIKQELSVVGIDVTINPVEWGTFLQMVQAGSHDMCLIGWMANSPDPDAFLYTNFHSSAEGGGNYTYCTDHELDQMLENGRKELDPTKRAEIYKAIQERIYDLNIWIPAYYTRLAIGTSKQVSGFEPTPIGYEKWNSITLTDK